MYELPTSIIINDKEYPIRNKGDYRTIINIIDVTGDPELKSNEIMAVVIIMFYENVNTISDIYYTFPDIQEAYNQVMKFISLNNSEVGQKTEHKMIDWVQDENLIVSAINNVAHTEIRALPYLHWWTFIGYYMSIGECSLATVVGIRSKIAEGRKLDKSEQRFRKNNPQYFVWERDLQKNKQLLDSIWNQEP